MLEIAGGILLAVLVLAFARALAPLLLELLGAGVRGVADMMSFFAALLGLGVFGLVLVLPFILISDGIEWFAPGWGATAGVLLFLASVFGFFILDTMAFERWRHRAAASHSLPSK